jgi:hypothetical protein
VETIDLRWNRLSHKAAQALTAWFGEGANHDLLDRGNTCRRRRAHVKAHPPRCLSGFRLKVRTTITPAGRRDSDVGTHELDELLESNPEYVAFEILPKDPACKPVLLGYNSHGELPGGDVSYCELFSPLAIRWEPSGEVVELIDCEQHGFAGEFDLNRSKTGLGPRERWGCSIPGCNDHRFVAIFHYPDVTPARDFDWYIPMQDQFRWFTMAAWCEQCAQTFCIAEYDCRE